jgi:hypothetical protein
MTKKIQIPVTSGLYVKRFLKCNPHYHHLDIAVKYHVMKLKTSSDPEDQNTIIKIKGRGRGSLTANRNENKNELNSLGST